LESDGGISRASERKWRRMRSEERESLRGEYRERCDVSMRNERWRISGEYKALFAWRRLGFKISDDSPPSLWKGRSHEDRLQEEA